MSNNRTIIDMQIFNKSKATFGSDFPKLIEVFLKDAEEQLKLLQQEIKNASPAEIADIAHQLKASSLTIGATSISETAKLMESIGRQNSLDRMDELYAELTSDFEKAKVMLTQLM